MTTVPYQLATGLKISYLVVVFLIVRQIPDKFLIVIFITKSYITGVLCN